MKVLDRNWVAWWVIKASDQTIRGSAYSREGAEEWVNTEGRRNVEYELYRVESKDGVTKAKKIDTLKRTK